MTDLIPHVIAGGRTEGQGTRRSDVFDPATGPVQRQVALGTAADVDAAVQAAKRAWPAWAATTPLGRARVMFRFRDLLEHNAQKLAAIITSEHGKVLSDALAR